MISKRGDIVMNEYARTINLRLAATKRASYSTAPQREARIVVAFNVARPAFSFLTNCFNPLPPNGTKAAIAA